MHHLHYLLSITLLALALVQPARAQADASVDRGDPVALGKELLTELAPILMGRGGEGFGASVAATCPSERGLPTCFDPDAVLGARTDPLSASAELQVRALALEIVEAYSAVLTAVAAGDPARAQTNKARLSGLLGEMSELGTLAEPGAPLSDLAPLVTQIVELAGALQTKAGDATAPETLEQVLVAMAPDVERLIEHWIEETQRLYQIYYRGKLAELVPIETDLRLQELARQTGRAHTPTFGVADAERVRRQIKRYHADLTYFVVLLDQRRRAIAALSAAADGEATGEGDDVELAVGTAANLVRTTSKLWMVLRRFADELRD